MCGTIASQQAKGHQVDLPYEQQPMDIEGVDLEFGVQSDEPVQVEDSQREGLAAALAILRNSEVRHTNRHYEINIAQ